MPPKGVQGEQATIKTIANIFSKAYPDASDLVWTPVQLHITVVDVLLNTEGHVLDSLSVLGEQGTYGEQVTFTMTCKNITN